MKIVDVSKFEDSIVLYFDTKNTTINAYTLASILVSFSDAAKAANSSINAGHEIEVIVEALGEGSFKAQITAVYEPLKNIFSSNTFKTITLTLLTNFMYERFFSLDNSVNVQIHTEEVIMEKNDERLVIPRHIYDETKKVEKNPKFIQSIDGIFQVMKYDDNINGFGFTESMESGKPQIIIPKEAIISDGDVVFESELIRVLPEIVELQILKAILERGNRKWEFMWRGVKISAPITSECFYADFFNHDITIAPGDSLEVKLEIKQVKNEETGIYVNKHYEVVEVFKHHPRLKQTAFENL